LAGEAFLKLPLTAKPDFSKNFLHSPTFLGGISI
jgi:hypothetical protein